MRHTTPLAVRDREKSFVGYFGLGLSAGGTVNRPGRAQDTNQVEFEFFLEYWFAPVFL